jgi:hypothetical protein
MVMGRVLSIFSMVFLTANLFGQATQNMNYLAEIRDKSDALVTSSPVGLRVSILEGSETGEPVYVETHSRVTDQDGLVTFELGSGTQVAGRFEDISWTSGTFFMKAETDPTGGMNYNTDLGTYPLLSEPNALNDIHYVGEYLGGGIVFHVYDGGKHGFITSTVDYNKWQDGTDTDSYTVRDGIATNKFNARRIIAIKDATAYDAREFTKYTCVYLSDWYLPTRYELELLYLHRSVLGGYDEFTRSWRSDEESKVNAWFTSFATGGKFTNGKDDITYVRVLRSF